MQIAKLATAALAAAALVAGLAVTKPAQATVILTFGQSVNGPTVTSLANAAGTATTVVGTNIPVLISQYLAPGAPISAYLSFDFTSTNAAQISQSQFLQSFNGNFSFTSLPNDHGTNYLSATFTDFVFGVIGGSSLVLASSDPPGSDVFTSGILDTAQLGQPRSISLGFADVTPPAAIVGHTLRSFSSSVSGTVGAAIPLPEPGSLTVLGAGLLTLGTVGAVRLARARRS